MAPFRSWSSWTPVPDGTRPWAHRPPAVRSLPPPRPPPARAEAAPKRRQHRSGGSTEAEAAPRRPASCAVRVSRGSARPWRSRPPRDRLRRPARRRSRRRCGGARFSSARAALTPDDVRARSRDDTRGHSEPVRRGALHLRALLDTELPGGPSGGHSAQHRHGRSRAGEPWAGGRKERRGDGRSGTRTGPGRGGRGSPGVGAQLSSVQGDMTAAVPLPVHPRAAARRVAEAVRLRPG
ncbi:hypothetical protein RKD30_000498 [Streptomyces pristinaespiralis]